MIVERTDFVSVPVTDLELSTAFYGDTLGLEQTGHGAWPEFRLGENVFLYLLDPTNIGREFEGPHTSAIALRVPDVEEARRELEAKGVAFHGETFDTGVCHMAHFADPDGNALMLHRRYAPPEGTGAH
ncbi:MAG TPA: VOC family protein [Gaiellaceae bacterium]|nr:VOC family protein [Gaiellaceae bacterium]